MCDGSGWIELDQGEEITTTVPCPGCEACGRRRAPLIGYIFAKFGYTQGTPS
jgi:hypothetical protein